MKVYINNGPAASGNLSNVDYTRYVVDGSLSIEDSINVPTLITFQLANIDQNFVVPRRSAYVTIVSEIYASGSGYGQGKILATGFITTESERTYLGLTEGVSAKQIPPNVTGQFNNLIHTYNIQATSDEWLLNSNSPPYIPAFVNQTDSQILAAMAQALVPGFFTTTLMASGTIIPYYEYDPTQTWSDVAKTFGDENRYHYKVINKSIIYQPFGDAPLGIAYDDVVMKEKSLAPTELTTALVTVPPVNDCIVLGDTEPQQNVDNYFIGDGFSSNFQLKHQVFDGTSTELLSDDWTESSFTLGTWTVNDPLGVCNLADNNGNAIGALNIIQKGAHGVYTPQVNATYIQAQNGLELGGGINLQHGQIVFNDTAVGGGGIIGGIYGSDTFVPGNVLAGYGITGQQGWSALTVTSVTILNGNTPLVTLIVTGPLGPIQPGYVLEAAGFSNATFLNGTKQVVQTITTVSPNTYSIVVQGTQIWTNPYSSADSGHVTAVANDVVVTASGAAGIVIQPILNGQFVGQPVVSQINCQYVLQTWIGANTQSRYTRQFNNLTGTKYYGNQNLAASGAVTFVITTVNLGNYVIEEQNPLFGLFPAAPPPVVTKYTAINVTLPPFALYCLINGIDLNVAINYTVLSLPPQGYLTVQSLTGMSGGNLPWLPSQLSPPIPYQLGYGMINQTAQISQQGEAYALSFYTDDIPSVGARGRFLSWSSGQSVARVRDTAAVLAEAAISGDSGVRSAIMNNLSPLPRTSAECEAAAGAAILDREYPQFQGTYTVVTIPYKYESLYSPSMYDYPKTGEFFWINSAVRGVSGQNFIVNTVRVQVVDLKQEVLNVSIDYGPDLYLEKLLPAFLERESNLLVPQQTATPPNYITLPQVLNYYLPTLDNAQILYASGGYSIVNSLTGNYITVDLGAPPVTACEVRNVDNGWGIAGQGRVGYFTTRTFTLPRTVRDQTWYLRTINGGQYSRFSKEIRVVYPLVPSAPTLVKYNDTSIVFDYAGDVRDIYGLEVRVPAVSGLNFIDFQNPAEDVISAFYRVALPSTTQTGNAAAIYNQGAQPVSFQTGDIVYLNCTPVQDSSFDGLRLVTGVGSGGGAGSGSTIAPSMYTGTYSGLSNQGGTGTAGGGINGVPLEFGQWVFTTSGNGIPSILSISSQCEITKAGTAILSYSLNGGLTYTVIYVFQGVGQGTSFRNATDTVYLPANQNLSQVLVRGEVHCPAGDQSQSYAYQNISAIGILQGVGVFPVNYNYFSWYDHGYTVETVGNPAASGSFGTAQLVTRGSYWNVVSGSINSAGIATVTTSAPHGLVQGGTAILSCGYATWPGGSYGSTPSDGAIFCGVYIVTAVPASNQIQFVIANVPWAAGLPTVQLTGLVAQLPEPALPGPGGVIVQRPIFAPSDLVVDLTQPDIAATLQLIESIIPGGRVSGLEAFFFNLTWDYSYPTVVPSFTVPALTGVIIDTSTQQVLWNVAQGSPDGYRVVITDANTGVVRNKFTLNHPNNPQLVTQFQLSTADYTSSVNITITPFDVVGDGLSTTINWPGYGGSNTPGGYGTGTVNNFFGASGHGTYTIGSTYNGLIASGVGSTGLVLVRIPFDIAVLFQIGWVPSQAWLETAPASLALTVSIYKIPAGLTIASQVLVGSFTFGVGQVVATFAAGSTTPSFNPGDIIRVVTPATVDTTAANMGLTLSGIKL